PTAPRCRVSRTTAAGAHAPGGAQRVVHVFSELRDPGDLRPGIRRVARARHAGTRARLWGGGGDRRRPRASAAGEHRRALLRGRCGGPAGELAARPGAARGGRRALRCLYRAHSPLARRRAAADRPRSALPPQPDQGRVAALAELTNSRLQAPNTASTDSW